ncbi:MAG TPA: hypothetical protein V6C90_23735 [Coleofasciculaceae cyanobacterium]
MTFDCRLAVLSSVSSMIDLIPMGQGTPDTAAGMPWAFSALQLADTPSTKNQKETSAKPLKQAQRTF